MRGWEGRPGQGWGAGQRSGEVLSRGGRPVQGQSSPRMVLRAKTLRDEELEPRSPVLGSGVVCSLCPQELSVL